MSHEWKYKIQSPQTGKMELGPFSEHEFVQLIDNGTIKSNTMVQCPERTKGRWVAAGRVPALARLIETREPLPPTIDTQQDQGSLSERLPTAHEWRYRIESPQIGKMELGPISGHEFVELIKKGVIDKTTMVVSATRTNSHWTEAGRVPALARLIEKRGPHPPIFDTQQDQGPMSHEWKYKIQSPQTGKMELGPIPEQGFVKLINNGVIDKLTMVQSATRTNGYWLTAGRVPALAHLMEKREPLPPYFFTQQDQGPREIRKSTSNTWPEKIEPAIIKCPFCAEEIKAEAKKCKHCGEFLDKKLCSRAGPVNISSTGMISNDARSVQDDLKQKYANMSLRELLAATSKFQAGVDYEAPPFMTTVLVGFFVVFLPFVLVAGCLVMTISSWSFPQPIPRYHNSTSNYERLQQFHNEGKFTGYSLQEADKWREDYDALIDMRFNLKNR